MKEKYYIGQIFNDIYPPEAAEWCNARDDCFITEIEPENDAPRFQIVNTPQESEEEKRLRLDMLSLTKREVFLALYKSRGITPEQLRSQITDPEALIEFDFANDYYRGNPLINEIGEMLGFTVEDLDHLFEYKELPGNEVK